MSENILKTIVEKQQRLKKLKNDPITIELKSLEKELKSLLVDAITGEEYELDGYKMYRVERNKTIIPIREFIKTFGIKALYEVGNIPIGKAKDLFGDALNDIIINDKEESWKVQQTKFWTEWKEMPDTPLKEGKV